MWNPEFWAILAATGTSLPKSASLSSGRLKPERRRVEGESTVEIAAIADQESRAGTTLG